MIAFLRGTVEDITESSLVLDVHGVGYEVLVSRAALIIHQWDRAGAEALHLHAGEGGCGGPVWISDKG